MRDRRHSYSGFRPKRCCATRRSRRTPGNREPDTTWRTVKDIVIDSDDALHRVVRDHGAMHLIFRGEDSASYALRPKYGRYQASDARNTRDGELALLSEFKRRAGPLLEDV